MAHMGVRPGRKWPGDLETRELLCAERPFLPLRLHSKLAFALIEALDIARRRRTDMTLKQLKTSRARVPQVMEQPGP
eukprot:13234770-Alexandrium_andersonii.AAC.1